MINSITKIFVLLAFLASGAGSFAENGNETKVVKNNISTELINAAALGQNTILVITDKNDTRLDEAMQFAGETADLSANIIIAVLNRSLEENAGLVEKYRLSRYPAPYLLIMSPVGVITGGASPGKIDAKKFAAYVPSPCYNKVLTAGATGKTAFIVVSPDQDGVSKEWTGVLAEAQAKMETPPEIINVSAFDESERVLLEKINYKNSDSPVVVVINAKGQVAATFVTPPDATQLVAATNKVVAKGCGSNCPSSKSCSGKEKAKCGSK